MSRRTPSSPGTPRWSSSSADPSGPTDQPSRPHLDQEGHAILSAHASRRRLDRRAVVLPTLAASLLLASACSNPAPPPPTPTPTPTPTASASPSPTPSPAADDDGIPEGGVFGPNSVWKADVRGAPVAANSTIQVDKLTTALSGLYGGTAAFNVYQYGVAWYTVGRHQPRSDVSFTDCQHKGYTPVGLTGDDGQFSAVPIPRDALPSKGTDSTLSIYQPSSDTLWNFWQAHREADGWYACWGGRISDVSTSPGYFTGAFGTSASGLSGEAGAVSINDAESGVIDHAVSLSLPPASLSNQISWPARRSDGGTGGLDGIAEGTRLRLPTDVPLDDLGLSPVALMVARAAQRYGFIVTDKAGTVSIPAETPLSARGGGGANPWESLLAGRAPYQVFKNFPWDRLQALPIDWGRAGS